MEFKRPETLIATGKSGKRIWKELGRSGINMIEYLQELRVRDGNNIRIINSHIF